MKQIFTSTLCIFSFAFITAQSISKDMYLAFKSDNVSALTSHTATYETNACFDVKDTQYILLALSVKMNATKCFDYLLNKEDVDVNKTCGGKTASQYTAKYAKLEMLKKLKKAGADLSSAVNGRSVLDYAKKYKQEEIVAYLSKE